MTRLGLWLVTATLAAAAGACTASSAGREVRPLIVE